MSGQDTTSDEKFEKILEALVELKNDVKHLTVRMDTRTAEIKDLAERVKNIEINMAVNDHLTAKNTGWLDYAFKGLIALFAGFIAVRLGLK